MLGRALCREAQHGHARLLETSHSLRHLSRADCNLRELISIWHGGHSHIGHYEYTILTILLLLGNQQQTTTHAGDARLTLDNLQCWTQGVASGGKSSGNLTVSTLSLDNHTTQVQGILNQFAGLLDGHTLILANLCQFLCQFLTLLIVLRVDESGLANVGESLLLGQSLYLCGITNQNDVGKVIA